MGILCALASSLLPLYHPFRNLLFSEPLVLTASVATLYHFERWLADSRRADLIVSNCAFALAVSLKLTPLYLLLPLSHACIRTHGVSMRSLKCLAAFTATSLVVPAAWYAWAYHLANNYIDVFGVFGGAFGGHNKFQTITMLGDWKWRHTMMDRITVGILGGTIGVVLALGGICTAAALRRGGVFWSYLLAIGAYIVIVAEGNLDAPYRQLTLIPPISVFVAFGAMGIAALIVSIIPSGTRRLEQHWIPLAMAVLSVLIVPYEKRRIVLGIKPNAEVSREKLALAREIQTHTNQQSKLVTVGEYSIHAGGNDVSPVLYYYTGATGLDPAGGRSWTRQLLTG